MPSMLPYARILGYVTTIVLHTSNMLVLSAHDSEHIEDENVRRFNYYRNRYFTCWTFFIQTFHAILGIICEILLWRNGKNRNYRLPTYLKVARDTMFASIVVPTTFLTATTFWSLFAYDRELIFPAFVDKILPPLNNHIMHTFIIPLTVWEIVFQPRYEPKSHFRYIVHITLHMGIYLAVLIYSYCENGVWIYPVFAKLYGTIYFYLFVSLQLALILLFYSAQWPLTYCIWGSKPVKNIVEKRNKQH